MSASSIQQPFPVEVPANHKKLIRGVVIAIVAVQVLVGIGFYRNADWATSLWPLPDVRMTYIFLASMTASTAAVIIWPVIRNDLGALRAAAFNISFASPPIGLYLLWLAWDRGERDLIAPGIMFVVVGLAALTFGRWIRAIPIRHNRLLPKIVRMTLVGFCVLLVPVGTALLFQMDNVFPWTLSPENSTVAGVIFLSAAALFGFVLVNPQRIYGELSFASFLAYDLVLAVPYLDFFRNRNDEGTVASYYGPAYAPKAGDSGVGELSMAIYLSVLAISAIASITFLAWTFWPRSAVTAMPAD